MKAKPAKHVEADAMPAKGEPRDPRLWPRVGDQLERAVVGTTISYKVMDTLDTHTPAGRKTLVDVMTRRADGKAEASRLTLAAYRALVRGTTLVRAAS